MPLILRFFKFYFIFTMVFLLGASCDTYKSLAEKRAEKAGKAPQKIVIGIVGSSTTSTFFKEGVKLALKEIDEQGGLLGKPVAPLFYDDKDSVDQAREIAEKLAKNTDVIAVVGHLSSRIALPASITYQKSGLLFISPGATAPELTQYNRSFIFRNIPSDDVTGHKIAAFAKRSGYKKVVILFDRDSGANRLTEIFHKASADIGIHIVGEKSYSSWETNFRGLIAGIMKKHEFDAVFLGGVFPAAGRIISQMREMGVRAPIIGNSSFDSSQLWEVAGKAADGTIVFTVFNPASPGTPTQRFVEAFKGEYDTAPDTWAAQGYDAIQTLAAAIKKSGSINPQVVGNAIRFSGEWNGVAGPYSWDWNGGISGKEIFFKVVENGSFKFLDHGLKKKINFFKASEEITLRLPLQHPVDTIDPGRATEKNSREIIEQLFLALTDIDPETNRAIPALAKSWSVSPNGKVVTFLMRDDAVWTDGTPVTANDIVWTIQRNIDPDFHCPGVTALYFLKNAWEINIRKLGDVSKTGVRALDDFTVEFSLREPMPDFPGLVTLAAYRPAPKKGIETYGDQWTKPENIQTNGSYKLAAWKKGQIIILQKNGDYYDADKVSIPEVRYSVISEKSMGLAMYRNNQLDITGGDYLPIPGHELLRIKADKILGGEYSKKRGSNVYAYGFNVKRSPVDHPLARKAIAASIERKLIINLAVGGGQSPARTFIPPDILGTKGFREDQGIAFNPDQAKKWLAEAGYPGGKGFPELTLLHDDSQSDLKIADALRASLKHHLGIHVKLIARDFTAPLKEWLIKDSPHMFQLEWHAKYPDPSAALYDIFHPLYPNNYTGWNDSDFVDLLRKAGAVSDPNEKIKFLQEAEGILCQKECVVAPIYFGAAHYMVKPRVEGWSPGVMGGQHIRNWSLKK